MRWVNKKISESIQVKGRVYYPEIQINKRPSLTGWPFVLIETWQFPTLTWGSPTLPSALRRFTSEFGMGSGGTTALSPPGKFFFKPNINPNNWC